MARLGRRGEAGSGEGLALGELRGGGRGLHHGRDPRWSRSAAGTPPGVYGEGPFPTSGRPAGATSPPLYFLLSPFFFFVRPAGVPACSLQCRRALTRPPPPQPSLPALGIARCPLPPPGQARGGVGASWTRPPPAGQQVFHWQGSPAKHSCVQRRCPGLSGASAAFPHRLAALPTDASVVCQVAVAHGTGAAGPRDTVRPCSSPAV